MHTTAVVTLFSVLLVVLVAGQNRNCDELTRRCERCVETLNNAADRNLPVLNQECRTKTRNNWRWRNVGRCELTRLNCLGSNRRMNCNDIAELAGMDRIN
uniref:Ecdysone-induced gene 71Ed n=1 Tax=Drosophila melanogaster TaxID=7227 RepID=Q27241_DROME|eukprot:NP_524091.1 Ecdysone-induced gene 71Ed [Drosophila melanogaster]